MNIYQQNTPSQKGSLALTVYYFLHAEKGEPGEA
jgi:hypothetical protein